MNRFLWFLAVLVVGCNSPERDSFSSMEEEPGTELFIEYAKGFKIIQYEGYTKLIVLNTFKGNNQNLEYILGADSIDSINKNGLFIPIPIKRIAALSSTYIPFIKLLEERNSIVAISGKNTIYDSLIYDWANTGRIKDLGEPTLNVEQTVLLDPDLIMGFAIDAQSMKQLSELERFNQKVLLNSEYMEETPLAKAEWIKVFGLLYDKEKEADSIFKVIKKRYLKLSNMVKDIHSRPSVFSSAPWKGTWFVPGGKSFQATLFDDAGANYIWRDNTENVSLSLDFEVVLSKAIDADFWLNTSTFQTLQEISDEDERFELFKAYKTQKVYNNTKTLTTYMGNDYWETGAARPDLILEDLVHIFHPDVNPNHVFNFYQKLK
ncbi:ABC transporter substrate-binding protein [Acidiluteibacter ferrifornacis]|uniref:ABC transporter substrate-binding protein n=1 Tax=Acidiluteibacter ferrifornacis TaxID=2692424 RepID=A0A6N9NJ84_9FLAO|nr:ABC transporter substrate-binding protein [Acidiluteibacter ferrifornacis]NBG65541.1 ABC transporter substrate-binding protein [Acidiluteibacter ferrifornacis]